jgi:hypothetical protein
MMVAGHVARMEKRNVLRLLVGWPEGKRQLGRPRCRWVNKIKFDVVEIEWGYVDWIDLAQNREDSRDIVNAVMKFFGFQKCRKL